MPLNPGYVSSFSVVDTGGKSRAMSVLYHQTWTNPIASDDDGLLLAVAGRASAGTNTYATADASLNGALVSAGACVLDFARNVSIVVTHASAVVALSGVITGKDKNGDTITEAWAVTAGTTSKTFSGKKAFATIVSITEVAAADASGNTVKMGTGQVLGIDVPVDVAAAVKERVDGSIVTNGTFVASSAVSTDDPRGTYSPNTAPDGAHDYDVWILSAHPEQG